jgi:homoserine kinase type II
VLTAFGLETPIDVQRAGGTASLKWVLRTPFRRLLVRVRPDEFADDESVRFDHEVLGRLKKAGLPVPAPLATADGDTWLSLDGRVYEVLEWVDGKPFDEADLDAVHEAGALLARFHRALAEDIPPGKKNRRREDHPDLLEPHLIALRKLTQDADRRRQLDEIARQLDLIRRDLDAGLYASLPHSLIHGDFHPGNVRFRGSAVAAIYDFDYLSVQARTGTLAMG